MGKKSKFQEALCCEGDSFICVKDKEEQEIVSSHTYPRDYRVIKSWAQEVLKKSGLPIPNSPLNSWFLLKDNSLVEIERSSSAVAEHAGHRIFTLSSYLKGKNEYFIEYKASQILQTIEQLEESLENNSTKGVSYFSVEATALYYETFININYSSMVMSAHRQRMGSKKLRVPQMPKLDNWILKQNLSRSAKELWHKLANENESYDGLFIEGDYLIEEKANGKEKRINFRSFSNRISRAKI